MPEEQATSDATTDETSDAPLPQNEVVTTSPSGDADETSSETTPQAQETADAGTKLEDLQQKLTQMQAALKKANAEAAKNRHTANELQKFKESIESERLSDADKQAKLIEQLTKDAAAAKKEAEALRLDHAITEAASRLNFMNLEDAHMYLKREDKHAEIEYDSETKQPSNITELLEAALLERPHWKRPAQKPVQTAGGATNPPKSVTASSGPIDIASMTPERYANLTPSERARLQEQILKRRR